MTDAGRLTSERLHVMDMNAETGLFMQAIDPARSMRFTVPAATVTATGFARSLPAVRASRCAAACATPRWVSKSR